MKDGKGSIIYIGKAKNLKHRIKQYFSPSREKRSMLPFLIEEIEKIETIVTLNEEEALLLENNLIKQHQPQFNALLKDDKNFISILIDMNEEWPRLQLSRSRGNKEGLLLFGPYTQSRSARRAISLFPLRQCSNEELKRRRKPCILYGMKQCLAPCAGKCSKEEYQSIVEKTIQFFKGNNRTLIKQLNQEIKQAAASLEFEKAATLLATLENLQHLTPKEGVVASHQKNNCDLFLLHRHHSKEILYQLFFRHGNLIGSAQQFFPKSASSDEELYSSLLLQYYRNRHQTPEEILTPIPLPDRKNLEKILSIPIHTPQRGNKKKMISMAEKNIEAIIEEEKKRSSPELLVELQKQLNLNHLPKKIECIDISHHRGSHCVAAITSFIDGNQRRSHLFPLPHISSGDDYAALEAALRLRLKRPSPLPNLLIIDGGRGQLNRIATLLNELKISTIDLIAIAKEEGNHGHHLTQEKIFLTQESSPILLPYDCPILFFLQNIRDKTDQKAAYSHRKQEREARLPPRAHLTPPN